MLKKSVYPESLENTGKTAIEVAENKGKSYKNLKKMQKSLSTETKNIFLKKA